VRGRKQMLSGKVNLKRLSDGPLVEVMSMCNDLQYSKYIINVMYVLRIICNVYVMYRYVNVTVSNLDI